MTDTALTPFTAQLFGADIEGGGLTETIHASKIILGSGITVTSFNEATKTATLAASVPEPAAHWREILGIDFSGVSMGQTFSGNGNVSIGGIPFVVENFANILPDVTHHMGVVGTQGLVLPCGPSGDNMYTAWRGSPLIRWKFPTAVTRGVPVRAACQIGASNTSDTFTAARLHLGIEYPDTVKRNIRAVWGAAHNSSEDFTLFGSDQVNNCVQTSGVAGVIEAADMIGVSCPEGVGPGCRYRVQSGSYALHYSDLGSMRQLGDSLGVKSADSLLTTDDVSVASDWGVALAYCDAGTDEDFYVTVRRLKVEAFY